MPLYSGRIDLNNNIKVTEYKINFKIIYMLCGQKIIIFLKQIAWA